MTGDQLLGSDPEVMTYERMWLGRQFTPHRFDLSSSDLRRYKQLFGVESTVTPTGLLAVHARKSYLTDGVMPSGGVMASLSVRYHQPLPRFVGLTFGARVTDQYLKKERGWVHVESTLTADDDVLATVLTVGVWPR